MRQAAHHHKLVVDEAYARHTSDHLSCVGVLCLSYFLCRNVVHYDGTVFGNLHHSRFRILSCYAGYGDFAQCLFVGCQRYANLLRLIARLNPVNFFILVCYVSNGQSVLLAFLQSGESEVAVDVGGGDDVRSFHLHGGTDKSILRFPVGHLADDVGGETVCRRNCQQHSRCHNLVYLLCNHVLSL